MAEPSRPDLNGLLAEEMIVDFQQSAMAGHIKAACCVLLAQVSSPTIGLRTLWR
jgi:hypothetical protein